MRKLNSLNDEFVGMLNEYSDWFFDDQIYAELNPIIHPSTEVEDPTSCEYLKQATADPDKYGFPRQCLAQNLEMRDDIPNPAPKHILKHTLNFTNELQLFLGAKTTALAMYYPPGGYIGWHHNGNAPGYNLILTINEQGNGEFEYVDLDKGVIKIPDEKIWTGKVGYFGDQFKGEDLCWHTARSRGHRLTMSFVIDNKNIWDHVIEEIES